MLPADIVGTSLERLPVFAKYNGNDPAVRSIFVSFTTNLAIAVLTTLVVFRLLSSFAFSAGQSAAGVLALLFATTHLHYSQNMSENNYILLLTLAGICFQYQWLCSGSRRSLTDRQFRPRAEPADTPHHRTRPDGLRGISASGAVS